MPMRLSLRLEARNVSSEQKGLPKGSHSRTSCEVSRVCTVRPHIFPVWTKSCHAAKLSDCENSGAIRQGYP